jgi:hypothetical protein
MCDSVDIYLDKAIGTGELSGSNEDIRYANALCSKIRCDYSRYESARARGDDDGKVLWGRSVVKESSKFFEYFSGSKFKTLADAIRALRNEVGND